MQKLRILGGITLVAICAAVVMLMEIPTWLKYKKGDIKDFSAVAAGELKSGDLVRGTIGATLGACAEEDSTTYGVRTSSKSNKLYYVLWMDNDNFILYETGSDAEFKTLDKIADEYDAYLTSMDEAEKSGDYADVVQPKTEMQFEGKVEKTPSKIQGYFKEWFDDDSTFSTRTETVMISRADFDRFSTTVYIGFGCALLAIVMGVLTFIVWRRERSGGY